jgi:hypothetical protein
VRSNGQVRLLPSSHSESARAALLLTGTSSRSDSLHVRYAEGAVAIALRGQGMPLLEGIWDARISIDGVPLVGKGDWEAVCWDADKDADYLELQRSLGNGARIDRQLLLPRKEHLAFLADSIIAPAASQISYQSRWPIAAGLRFRPEPGSRAVRLRGAKAAARIIPLALPAEPAQSTADQLTGDGDSLELIQHGQGTALHAPLVIDWSPKRLGQQAFWRGLTVSERSRILSADVAVGYRLRIKSAQWLFYHSLHNSGEPRAVLGHHTWSETVVGPFRENGTVAPWIVVE